MMRTSLRADLIKKRVSLGLVWLFLQSCGGGQEPSSEGTIPIVKSVRSSPDMANTPAHEYGTEFSIIDPVVIEVSLNELRNLRFSSLEGAQAHSAETRVLEQALMNWLSERPFERKCIAYTGIESVEQARDAYVGETIGVIGPDNLTLPLIPIGKWIRMSEEQLDSQSKQECQAMPYLELLPNNDRFTYEGKEYVSGGCYSGFSQYGLIAHYYPIGNRAFLAHRDQEGRVHITRSTWISSSSRTLEDQIKQRLTKIDEVCDTRSPSGVP